MRRAANDRIVLAVACAFALIGHASTCSVPRSISIVVEGGQSDRPVAIISFALGGVAGSWISEDSLGRISAVQISKGGQAQLILHDLKAGEKRWLSLSPAAQLEPRVSVVQDNHVASFKVDRRQITAYHTEIGPLPRPDIDPIYRRAGYLHPIYTPDGTLVSDDYPPNHIHHHGVWAAWTRTVFEARTPDFWNMGSGTGRVEVVEVDSLWSGNVVGGMRAKHQYLDILGDKVALLESWQVLVYDTGAPVNIIDVEVDQYTATDSTLTLMEYHYGGVGFRGHRDWDGAESADFLTSEGRTRADGHATRARWCHIGGLVEGDRVGIAVMGYPDNLEAPQPMRIHPTEPFFNFAPTQAGGFQVSPGDTLTLRYRFVTYDGAPDAGMLDALWEDYATPAQVTIMAQD